MAYATLRPGVAWLKNFGTLVEDPDDGMTADDLREAEAYADGEIQSWAQRMGYDHSSAPFTTAPLVVRAARMFGSAYAIGMKVSRNGAEGDGGLVAALESDARALLERVGPHGLVAADGDRIVSDVRAVPQIANPTLED